MDMFRFTPDSLRIVDLGARISEDEKTRINDVVGDKYPHAIVRQAKFHDSEFALGYVDVWIGPKEEGNSHNPAWPAS